MARPAKMPAIPMEEVGAVYEARSTTIAALAARAGVAVPTLMRWAKIHGWERRGEERTLAPARSSGSSSPERSFEPAEPSPATPAGRRRLVARIWAAADAQMADVERRMRAAGEGGADERDARITAVLVRTVRDLVALDGELEGGAAKDDERPNGVTPDAIRDELVRRLEARLRDG